MMKLKNFNRQLLSLSLWILLCTVSVAAQTATFNYQGKLTDNGTPQTIYQMEFRLFGSPGGADQICGTIINPNVSVHQGVFTVNLTFSCAEAFTGADRFLQISVRRNADENFITLNPRQQITSSPFSIRTLSAQQADVALDSQKLGGVPASDYVTTANAGNSFVKNSTTPQTAANFNIAGSGVVGGNFGIGTNAPRAKFHVVGSSWFQGDTTPLPAAAGKGIVIGFGGELGYIQAFDYGTFTPKNLLLNNSGGNVGINTTAPRATLDVAGNAVQDRDKGGIAKAMLYVSQTGTIQRCYNGTTGASTGDCGFSVTRIGNGFYRVNFGFQVTDRFVSVTTHSSAFPGNGLNTNAQIGFDTVRLSNTTIVVRTFVTYQEQAFYDSDFFIFVY